MRLSHFFIGALWRSLAPIVFISALLGASSAVAVPTSFLMSPAGNMRDVSWSVIESGNVSVYYDSKVPAMGRYVLKSVTEAYPYLSSLLGVHLGEPKPANAPPYSLWKPASAVFILGDRYDGVGFANPVTEKVEAQLVSARDSAFFQHELVHRLMYEHNDFHIGPLGRVFSLAMMPTWWIEGLAEHLTESVGRQRTDGFERTMALQNGWPSWEGLHALYNTDSDTSLRGYVTSGRFLRSILSRVPNKSLPEIHEDIAMRTITPFFYSAVDNWLKDSLKATGAELYVSFQKHKKEEWLTYLDGMPALLDAQAGATVFRQDKPRLVVWGPQGALMPVLHGPYEGKTSVVLASPTAASASKTRKPVPIWGSSVVVFQRPQNSSHRALVTTAGMAFSNGARGQQFTVVDFQGGDFPLRSQDILRTRNIPFATKEDPLVVQSIVPGAGSSFFVHAFLRGESQVYLLNTEGGKNATLDHVQKLASYPFPAWVKLVGASPTKPGCVLAVVNWDHQQTSLQQICQDGSQTEVFAKNQLEIQDGFAMKDARGRPMVRVLATWDRVLAVFDVHLDNQTIIPLAAFPEWVDSIVPIPGHPDQLGAWVYKKGAYELVVCDVLALKNHFTAWQHRPGSKVSVAFKHIQKFQPAPPVYQEAYQAAAKQDNAGKAGPIFPSAPASPSYKQVRSGPAAYDREFLFAFPYFTPGVIGGASINLAAFPYQDKIDRDAVQIFGGYNFYLETPSGAVSYINRRFLDGFALTAFSQPFFNGVYDTYNGDGTKNRSYNYLQQQGVSLGNLWRLRPTSFELKQAASLAKLAPYNKLSAAPAFVGPQNTTLFSLIDTLSFSLFKTAFYWGPSESQTGADFASDAHADLVWQTSGSVGGGVFRSLGGSTNAAGGQSGALNYNNANASLQSRFTLGSQAVTLAGRISTTQGSGTFNLQEFNAPYQSYIAGNTASLNYAYYPILSSGSLFDIAMGSWSSQVGATYEFPLLRDFESLFLMSYVNRLRGFLAINQGGVSTQSNGAKVQTLTTISTGTSVTLDIKGFQMEPSLFYGQLLERSGWGIIAQVKMMNIL